MSRGKLDYLFIVSRCVLTNEHSKKKSRDADERLCLHFGCVRWFQEIGVSFSRSLSSSLSESLKCAIIVHKSHKLFSVCVCFRCAFSIPPRSRKKELMCTVKMYFTGETPTGTWHQRTAQYRRIDCSFSHPLPCDHDQPPARPLSSTTQRSLGRMLKCCQLQFDICHIVNKPPSTALITHQSRKGVQYNGEGRLLQQLLP
jgi:hypothetical protein